jgi:hypothetical protein
MVEPSRRRSRLPELVARQLPARGDATSARFALTLRPRQASRLLEKTVRADLRSLHAEVRPLLSRSRRVLVLDLPGFTLEGCDPPVAFGVAYALADAYDLVSAEPDLPTTIFLEPEVPPSEGAGPAEARELAAADPGATAKDWPLGRLDVRAAWDFSTAQGRPSRGQGAVVAQPDTGITPHA